MHFIFTAAVLVYLLEQRLRKQKQQTAGTTTRKQKKEHPHKIISAAHMHQGRRHREEHVVAAIFI